MYIVVSDHGRRETLLTNRRAAWTMARREARANGNAQIEDALRIEPTVYFDLHEGGHHVDVCRCTAEARLLRAIFNEPHPQLCTEPKL
jgi:hypothetical protein